MYNRITAYIYNFENCNRLAGVGYCRVDISDKEYKLAINLKLPSRYQWGVGEIYLLIKREENLYRVFAGKMTCSCGEICYKCVWCKENLPEKIDRDEIVGILIIKDFDLSKGFLCGFNGNEIELSELINITGLKSEENVVEKENYERNVDWKEEVFKRFPKIKLYLEGEEVEAIKLKPHDIIWLPRKYWSYSSNKCLMNSYDSYRYILLVKMEMGEKYILAIPGRNMVNECFEARKNGFKKFIPYKGGFGFFTVELL